MTSEGIAMSRERHLPAAPMGTDGPYLVAILDVLDDLHTLLRDRLPQPPADPGDEAAQPIREPAPDEAPPAAIAVTEPAPDVAPRRRGRSSTKKTTTTSGKAA
jgi:hypothetical protein